jgi:hypothetical protein
MALSACVLMAGSAVASSLAELSATTGVHNSLAGSSTGSAGSTIRNVRHKLESSVSKSSGGLGSWSQAVEGFGRGGKGGGKGSWTQASRASAGRAGGTAWARASGTGHGGWVRGGPSSGRSKRR